MGICDDGPYILMARHLARTGNVVYNGWAAPMLGWQLYLGAAFIKLFGFSFTTVRMSSLLVAVCMAFVLQRTLARAGINERNATLGTLAFVLSPLYLMLSVTYMSDTDGLFAVVLCLYGCLRSLQAPSERSTIFWLCFAAAANAIFGTSRQIAWLGILVMVPSALYSLAQVGVPGWRGKLRERRRVLLAGSAVTLVGAIFVFTCMEWLKHQPYTIPERLIVRRGEEFDVSRQVMGAIFDIPFLFLPVAALFSPELRRSVRSTVTALSLVCLAYVSVPLAAYQLRGRFQFPRLLEPSMGDWASQYAGYAGQLGAGHGPAFLCFGERMALTIVSLGGLLGLGLLLSRPREDSSELAGSGSIRWRQLCLLIGPFVAAQTLLLIPRAGSDAGLYDRYLLEPLAVALPWLVRLYQERVQVRMPTVALPLVATWAIYGIVTTHDMFSLYRARVALAAELRASGLPDTSVDYGWESNLLTEIDRSGHTNDPQVEVPLHAYAPAPPLPVGSCLMLDYDFTPHIRPLYGVSFDPHACYGPAPFAPVHYSRWPYRTPGTLYVVRYLPSSQIPHRMP